jgi:hypothetical protein
MDEEIDPIRIKKPGFTESEQMFGPTRGGETVGCMFQPRRLLFRSFAPGIFKMAIRMLDNVPWIAPLIRFKEWISQLRIVINPGPHLIRLPWRNFPTANAIFKVTGKTMLQEQQGQGRPQQDPFERSDAH